MVNHTKRVCITGTAPTWTKTPWNDAGLEIWSLNDAYTLGLRRADRWFDIHPIDQFWYRKINQREIRADQVPPGRYIRPEGHLDWLKNFAKTNPVYLKDEPPPDWPPNARRFPWEEVLSAFGDKYWACGPSYMLALAILEGFTEIWITGIHLATQKEYLEQRPQWENLLGRLLGRNVKEYTRNGFKYFDGDVRIVMPEECPIMAHGWKYALEPRPEPKPNPYADELRAVHVEKQALVKDLIHWPVGKDKTAAMKRLKWLEIVEIDCQQQLAKAQGSGTLVAKLIAA